MKIKIMFKAVFAYRRDYDVLKKEISIFLTLFLDITYNIYLS